MNNGHPENAANTPVMFSAEDYALLRALVRQMQDFVESVNKRQAAAELRIEEAHTRLDAQNLLLAKWAAFGAGGACVLGALGWLAKFVLKIG